MPTQILPLLLLECLAGTDVKQKVELQVVILITISITVREYCLAKETEDSAKVDGTGDRANPESGHSLMDVAAEAMCGPEKAAVVPSQSVRHILKKLTREMRP